MVDTLYEGQHISMVSRGGWEYATRPHVSGIVGIVAVTDDGKLLLVEQRRPPVDANVIEIPAGLAGDHADVQGEPLANAASRELLEETGYRAAAMTKLVTGVPSAGITDERITLFLATGLVREHGGGGDDSEDIVVHEIVLGDVPDFLEACIRRGVQVDLKVYAALYFALAARRAAV